MKAGRVSSSKRQHQRPEGAVDVVGLWLLFSCACSGVAVFSSTLYWLSQGWADANGPARRDVAQKKRMLYLDCTAKVRTPEGRD
jgi:hypothetical protein